jgi:hypothetical protein
VDLFNKMMEQQLVGGPLQQDDGTTVGWWTSSTKMMEQQLVGGPLQQDDGTTVGWWTSSTR